MKILVITGSPHKNGTSALLVENFLKGAAEKGHTFVKFEAAMQNVKPCFACNYCVNHQGQCVQKDDMERLKPYLLDAKMIVFSTPLYYFGMSAQIKAVIDRFYAVNETLRNAKKSSALIAACGDEDSWAMDSLLSHYKSICRYLNFEDKGSILAKGVYERKDIEFTEYPRQAYEFGRKLG